MIINQRYIVIELQLAIRFGTIICCVMRNPLYNVVSYIQHNWSAYYISRNEKSWEITLLGNTAPGTRYHLTRLAIGS